MTKIVVFETVSGPGGTGHYLDDYRCGGSKPWGGGEVTYRAELSPRDIVAALQGTKHGKAALDEYVKRTTAAEQPAGTSLQALPDRTGIYAWVSAGSTALVLVNKRPSQHAPGGQLNGHVIDSTRFYDGCAISDWGRDGRWTLLHDFDAQAKAQEGASNG